jgi:3-keto-disaccharide hydrolase
MRPMSQLQFVAGRKLVFVIVLGVVLCGFSTAGGQGSDGPWQALFDGKALAGWTNPYEWGKAWVEDGEIRLQADKKFFLVTEQKYRDFIFEAEIKMPEGQSNSGFMFRCHQQPNRVFGYQAEVDPSDRQWSGGLYDEGRRGWLHPRSDNTESAQAFVKASKGAFKRHDWNRYRIHCVGNSIRIYLNGVMTTDYMDATDRTGCIAIQHHGEKGKVYRFRNLRIRELKMPAALTGTRNDLPLVFFDDFESGAGRWIQTDPNAWKVVAEKDNHVYAQHQRSQYEPPVRSPYNMARIKDVKVSDFTLQARMKQTSKEYGHRDMCLFFGYQDPAHFYYVHIATKADPHANSIFLVNGTPRVSIAQQRTDGTDWATGYHDVRIVRNVTVGTIEVFFDDMEKPIMKTVDKTFGTGEIGFGTFDDTGNIDNVIVWGK